MKNERRLLVFSIILGLLSWVADGFIDWALFRDEGRQFWDELLLDIQVSEIYFRSVILICLVGLGLVASRLLVARRRAQESLQASEERLATTLHSIGDAVIATDGDGRITFLNSTAQRLTGWPPEEAIGKDLGAVFHPVDARSGEPLEIPIVHVLQEGTVTGLIGDIVLVGKDGVGRPIEDSVAPITDRAGNVTGAVLAFRDVGESRRVTEALRREKELAQKYLSTAGTIMVVLNARGNVTLINRKGCDLLGWDEQDILGKNWFETFLPEPLRQPTRAVFSRLMAGEVFAASVEHYDNPVLTRTGEERIIAWHNTVMTDEHGAIIGTLSSGEDITDRLRAFASLQESEERFRAVFTVAEDCIFVKDGELRYTHVNSSMERLLGIRASEAIGQPAGGRTAFSSVDHARETDAQVMKGETIEEEITRPVNGVPTTFHLIKKPIRDRSGAITGLFGIARNITRRKRSEDALRDNEARLQRQNAALARLDMRRLLSGGDLLLAVRKITKTAAEALRVERLGVWLYTEDRSRIRCIDQFEYSKEQHSEGVELTVSDYPNYFRALEENRTIAAPDARTDPRTREFTDDYLTPLGITSMLDSSIRVGGHIAGIVCCKHVGPPRQWPLDEQNFAGSMADLVALALQIFERDRIQEALRQSEERFRNVAFSTADWIWEVNAAGVYTYCSPRIQDFLGYSMDEVLGRTPFDFMPADEAERVGRIFAAIAARRGPIRDLENRNVHKDGRIIHLLTNAVPIIDAQGTFMGYRGCDRDLSERKQTQEIVHQEEDRATRIFEAMDEGICLVDPDYNIEYANSALVKQFGPYAGKKCYRYCDDRDTVCPWCKIAEVRAGKSARWTWHSSKTEKTFSALAAPVAESGAGGHVLVVLRDVSEFTRRGQTVRHSRKLVEQIFRESHDVLLIVGEDGEVRKAGDAVRSTLGYDPGALAGMNIAQLLPAQGGEPPEEFLARLRVYGGVFEARPVLRADGSTCRMDITATIITWDREKAVLATFRDVTERQAVEEQLRQSQKIEAVGRLAGGVAHDFNNLLSIITGHSELLLQCLASDNRLVHHVQEINDAGQRAANLTRQLLAFSRKQVPEPKTLNLNTIIANVDNMLQRLIGEDISLITLPDSKLGAVRADPGQIEQVLMNLVVNARDAMPHGGIITIETTNIDLDEAFARERPDLIPGQYVMLSVSDAGQGMDADVKAHIFEPFFTTKEAGKGTGLGLSTVYGIVRQSDGHIEVDSEPERGTTFRIYLPRVETAVDTIFDTHTHQPAPRGNETVLVVEDEPGVRDLVCDALRAQGYVVLAADDGVAAMQINDRYEGPIHLLVTDVVMPWMSGLDLAERLGPKRPEMKVMFMSGYTDHAVVLTSAAAQGGAFLQKPFALDHFCRVVRAVLDGITETAETTAPTAVAANPLTGEQ